MNEQERELDLMVGELEHENRLIRARNGRLEAEVTVLTEMVRQHVGEPCGWQFYHGGKWHNGYDKDNHRADCVNVGYPVRDVYPSPQRTWGDLTEEQIFAIGKELGLKCRLGGNPNIDIDYARAIEAKLKELNT